MCAYAEMRFDMPRADRARARRCHTRASTGGNGAAHALGDGGEMSVALAARAAVAARAAHRAPRLGMRRAAGSHRPAAAGGASGAAQLATGKFGEELYADITWPEDFPFGPADLKRMDESSDFDFYAQPRFCTHIDDFAIGALTRWYEEMLPRGDDVAVLDMCSSWISHYPEGYSAERVVGLGMNEEELKRNKQLTEFVVKVRVARALSVRPSACHR